MLRALRWTALAAVAPALWACNARSLEKPTLQPEQSVTKSFSQSINRDVDLLFMVDNSSSMRLSQDNLRKNFPAFMNRLADPPGLPNIHVAVVSSDMGAGYGDISGCDASSGPSNPGGNKGIFQYSARGDCTATNLQPGATFISNVAGQANYTGNLADVFSCIAALGDQGCGFEHQFASVLRALGADGSAPGSTDRPPPAENQGFLRPGAYLVVIFITNEDDCSSAVEPQFFDVSSNWSQKSQLGETFRCNEFGHLCKTGGGALMHPDRNAPGNDATATVSYDTCTSDDASGYLIGVKDTAARLKALKSDPTQVLVAAITGPTGPYVVHWKNPTPPDTSCGAASCPWPEITHSCMAADTSYADPAIRMTDLVSEFGTNGLVLSICDDSFAPALDQIAALIDLKLTPPCITQAIANKPGTSDPDCTITSRTPDGAGGTIETAIPACSSNGSAAPCWHLEAGTCPDGSSGQVVRVSADPNVTTSTAQNATVNCALAPN
jgi:hypothetical protein